MAHIPLIHGADGAKLSKRHGALGAEAYRAMGYLPAAMRNYLVRLGWSHGDQEIFSTEDMIAAFDLPAIGRSPARFDLTKLESLNGHYMRQTSDADLTASIERVLPYLPNGAALAAKLDADLKQKLTAAMPGLKERAKTLVELIESARYLWGGRPVAIDDKARALLTPEARALVGELAGILRTAEPWDASTAEAAVRAFAEKKDVKLGAIAQPLRAALTGRVTSPGIFEVLTVLGREESLARLIDQASPTGGITSAAE
jgi:glutamyl-tRNA synthetase